MMIEEDCPHACSKGWRHAGEMDYWRVKALHELDRDSETASRFVSSGR